MRRLGGVRYESPRDRLRRERTRDRLEAPAIGFGHLLLVRAFAVAPASLLAPFTYFHLVVALLLGFVVFGNMPDSIALAGMGLIVSTGVVMALRQRAPAKAARE